jgi:hypothetical protein
MKSYIKFIVILLSTTFLFTNALAQETQTEFQGGVWQMIVDGQEGEGAPFYRFEFDENGTLKVTKQCGGRDNIVEYKSWSREGNSIQILSKPRQEILEFDGSTLIIESEKSIQYKNDAYESVAKPYYHNKALIHWVLILVVLIVLNEIFRKSKYATILFYIILPLVLTFTLWSEQGVTHWFKWVKVYSVIFAVIWFTLIRYTNAGSFKWVKLVAALILAINIAEAVSQDLSMGFLPNVLNGIAGILNIITLFYGWKQIGPDKSKEKDMVWPKMTIFWIVAYDIWNIVYVYLNFPGSTSAQAMVILACTIPALFIKKGTWLQARGFTLAAWFMYYFTFPRFTEQMELLVPRSYNLMLIVASISILVNIIYFFVFIKKLKQK